MHLLLLSLIFVQSVQARSAPECSINFYLYVFERDLKSDSGIKHCLQQGMYHMDPAALRIRQLNLRSRDADFCAIDPQLPAIAADCKAKRDGAKKTFAVCQDKLNYLSSLARQFSNLAASFDPVKCANEKLSMELQSAEILEMAGRLESNQLKLKHKEASYQRCLDLGEETKTMIRESCP